MAHPDQTFAANVRSTELVVRALTELHTRKVVAASTADVYSTDDIVHRETEPPAPCNPYGLSKALSEQLLVYGARISDRLLAASLRLSNIYGPLETNPHLIPRAIELIANRNLPEIRMGYLGGTRDFIHVYDVVGAIVATLFANTGKYDCFNVATGTATSSRRVMEILQQEAGDLRPVVEDHSRFRKFDRKSLSIDVSKIYERTGWRAGIALKDGLRSLLSAPTTIATVPVRRASAIAA